MFDFANSMLPKCFQLTDRKETTNRSVTSINTISWLTFTFLNKMHMKSFIEFFQLIMKSLTHAILVFFAPLILEEIKKRSNFQAILKKLISFIQVDTCQGKSSINLLHHVTVALWQFFINSTSKVTDCLYSSCNNSLIDLFIYWNKCHGRINSAGSKNQFVTRNSIGWVREMASHKNWFLLIFVCQEDGSINRAHVSYLIQMQNFGAKVVRIN